MKIFLKFLKWVGITLGALLVLFIGINAFDEKLDPGAAAILNAQPQVRAEDNAYFYLVGLRAPLNQVPSEFGQRCITRLTNISKNYKETITLLSSGKVDCVNQENTLGWKDISIISCERQKESCFSYYQKQSEAIKRLANKNEILLQRYEQLLAGEQFEDGPYTNQVTLALPFDLTNELYSAVSAIKLQEGNPGEFVQRTAVAAKFYRMVLRSNSGFLSKVISLHMLNRTARLTSDAVRAYPILAREHSQALLTTFQSLTVAERSLASVMKSDLKELAGSMAVDVSEESPVYTKALAGFTIKYNATINRVYQDLPGWQNLSQLPPEQYLAAEKVASAQLTEPWRGGYAHMIYNPLGKILAGIGTSAYASYPRRFIDVDGLLRLVSLQIQIAAQKIPESGIPAFLRSADSQFRDPYTGHPMQWDKTHGLYFRGYSERITDKDGFVSVKL